MTKRKYNCKKLVYYEIFDNIEEAIKYGNRIIIMDKGKIVKEIDKRDVNLSTTQLMEIFLNNVTTYDDRILVNC